LTLAQQEVAFFYHMITGVKGEFMLLIIRRHYMRGVVAQFYKATLPHCSHKI